MDAQLHKLAEKRYSQEEFLNTLHQLALAEQWFDLQHVVQHDMAKAILADYSYGSGKDYLDPKIFYAYWEEVIEIGWQIFCQHTGISREHVRIKLSQLHESI
jgi:hypothetical protein